MDDALTAGSAIDADRTGRSALWVYWIQGRARAYYFVPGTAATPAAVGHLSSTLGPMTLTPTLPARLTPFLEQLDPVYRRAAHMFRVYSNGLPHAAPLLCSPLVQAMTIRSEQDVETAVRTDSYSLLFAGQLDALMQVYAVGNATKGTARLLVTTAIPSARLDSLVGRSSDAWPLHVRVTAVDTLSGTVARSDTLRRFAHHPVLAAGSFLGFISELPVRAGHYVTHAAVFDSTMRNGSAAEWGNVVVQPSAFSISDIVLAVERGGVLWENDGDPVRVNVTGAYHRGEPAPVYYELYGRVTGRRYHTTITVQQRGKQQAAHVAVEFSRAADRPDAHVQLTLDLSRFRQGMYVVTVTVRDEVTGSAVETARVVEVAD